MAEHLGGSIQKQYDYYDSYKVTAPDGRAWKIMYDGSLRCQRKVNGQKVAAGREYSVEIVSPILTYEKDIETLQEMVRKIRKVGGFPNSNGRNSHTPRWSRPYTKKLKKLCKHHLR